MTAVAQLLLAGVFWIALISVTVCGLLLTVCGFALWRDGREARRDAAELSRLVERAERRQREVADLDFAWKLPARPDGPRLAR